MEKQLGEFKNNFSAFRSCLCDLIFSPWDSPLLRRGCVCFLRWHLGPSAMIFALCLNAASRIEPPLPPRLPPPHNRPLSAPGLRHSALRHNLFTVRTYLLWRPAPCGKLTTSSNLGQHSTCVISVYYIKEQTDKKSLEGMGKFTGNSVIVISGAPPTGWDVWWRSLFNSLNAG